MIPSVQSGSFCLSMQSAARRISSSSSSIPRFKRVLVESDAVRRSKRCFAASVPSESFEERKRSNRIPKQERREMLEAFVNKYRALNAGRFPTVSHAQKQVGGSYYVVREIIQELEYSHKMSPWKSEKLAESGGKTDVSADTYESPTMKDGVAVGSVEVEVPLISMDSKKAIVEESAGHSTIKIVQSSELVVERIEDSRMVRQISSDDHTDLEDTQKDSPLRLVSESGKDNVCDTPNFQVFDIEVPEKESPLMLANEDEKDNVHGPIEFQADASVPLKLETEVGILNTPAHDARGTIGDKSSTASAEEVLEQRSSEEVSKSDKLTGGNSRTVEEEEDASSKKGSSIWGNLKSLAGGIINFWRKK